MSPAQTKLYWREWGAVRERDPEADRHELHRAALGRDKSSKALSNKELDLVLAEFRRISRPADLQAQLRQLDQERTRKLYKLGELKLLLAVYVGDADGYIKSIVRDKFGKRVAAPEDLSNQVVMDGPAPASDGPAVRPYLAVRPRAPSQLDQLLMTLSRALNGANGFRACAGDSVHTMYRKAGLACPCSLCARNRGRWRPGGEVVGAAPQQKMEEPF